VTNLEGKHQPKPEWLKIRPPSGENYKKIKGIVSNLKLNTVCSEANCPNVHECWGAGTATFMIMGDVCTRGCRFCNVKTGNPKGYLDPEEPINVAESVRDLDLEYVVLTSVDRDDLPDGGAHHFANTIIETKILNKNITIEVLIPDFGSNWDALEILVNSKPDVIGHNVETVERLSPKVRDRKASYRQSLNVLEKIKEINPQTFTKSSIMLGLGETEEEIFATMKDLRSVNVDILTFGQYLQPSKKHLDVVEFVHPDKFKYYSEEAIKLGFSFVPSGPLVRSSYKAGEFFIKNTLLKK